jgi:hypothetical protein
VMKVMAIIHTLIGKLLLSMTVPLFILVRKSQQAH